MKTEHYELEILDEGVWLEEAEACDVGYTIQYNTKEEAEKEAMLYSNPGGTRIVKVTREVI